MSNIIQLLTGEVAIRTHDVSIYFSLDEWDYIKGNKDLYREGIKEEPQKLRPMDIQNTGFLCNYMRHQLQRYTKNKRSLYCEHAASDNNGSTVPKTNPSKTVAEGAVVCGDRNTTNPDISPPKQPPKENCIKSGSPASKGGSHAVECGLKSLPEQVQGRHRSNPLIICSLTDSTSPDYISNDIKPDFLCKKRIRLDNGIKTLTEKIHTTDASTSAFGRSLDSGFPVSSLSRAIKEEPVSWEERSHSGCSMNPLTEQIEKTNTFTPIMGYSFKNSLSANYYLNGMKEEVTSFEGGTRSICSINPLADQIQRNKISAPVMGCGLNNRASALQPHVYSKKLKSNATCLSPLNTPLLQVMYCCAVCHARFASYKDLVSHLITHTEEKTISCSICGKSFKRHAEYIRHQKIHTGEKPFICSECGKCFKQRSELNLHRRGHTGEKPFSCSECGKCFKRRSIVVEHQRIHTGEKPFTCSECGKCFTQRSHLIVHRRTHTGKKPFSCSVCGKCFTRHSQLILHLRTHTGD
ncbi:oocyte zinc finger protein XlCOF7.1-like [Xenopus laevis]|uniref:Oocyte zinc finger protein XlCOF7.1-like n=1 Tax=Xenopus laevis TaxID=8355 RepID=A0A8J0U3Y8_XENLA|nr:oocyte zinc finger protein XlCOF7.1-like [Xenopus laevis]